MRPFHGRVVAEVQRGKLPTGKVLIRLGGVVPQTASNNRGEEPRRVEGRGCPCMGGRGVERKPRTRRCGRPSQANGLEVQRFETVHVRKVFLAHVLQRRSQLRKTR